jgi:hypothetical protein
VHETRQGKGGHSIAVYSQNHRKGYGKQPLEANRVDYVSAADYSEGKQLEYIHKTSHKEGALRIVPSQS